jgi:RNA polymerase sigma-70 factor (ECF subfamily)
MSIGPLDETGEQLADYASGNPAAINELLERYRPFLRRVVQVRLDASLRGRVDPSDIVQETHVEVVRRLGDYLERRPMSFRAWLHRTVCQQLQLARRLHRDTRSRTVDREIAIDDQSSVALAALLLGESPSQSMERDEIVEKVRNALERLPPLDREILLLRNFEALTNIEAAEILEVPPMTAAKRYGRALIRLREELKGIQGRL